MTIDKMVREYNKLSKSIKTLTAQKDSLRDKLLELAQENKGQVLTNTHEVNAITSKKRSLVDTQDALLLASKELSLKVLFEHLQFKTKSLDALLKLIPDLDKHVKVATESKIQVKERKDV